MMELLNTPVSPLGAFLLNLFVVVALLLFFARR